MKMTDLSPGWYKVRPQEYNAYGAKHRRKNNNVIEILRVIGVGDNKRYYLDHDTVGAHPRDMTSLGNYEIVSKYDGEPTISKCRISISFQDASGTEFVFSVTDVWGLRNLFEFIPWLKKPFGYVPRKRS